MLLTVIGSGTAALQATRGFSGYILQLNSDLFLLDGGSGTLRKCAEHGISHKHINKIFYTHLHPDHCTDLIPFLFATKHTPGFTRTADLEMFGPVGFQPFYEKIIDVYGAGLIEVEYNIRVQELSATQLDFSHWSLETNLMRHTPNSIGYRFTANGKVFVYSGDTDYCDEIVELAREADVLLLECSFPDEMKVAGHLTPSEAGKIAATAGAKKLILTHLYPPCDEADILPACKAHFSGEVTKAADLMTVEI